MLCMAALLVWPAQLGWGRLNSALLAEGSDLAPWGLSTALLLLCRFIPGRLVQCTTGAQRLRVAETRLCRGMQKARRRAEMLRALELLDIRKRIFNEFQLEYLELQ